MTMMRKESRARGKYTPREKENGKKEERKN